MQHNPMSLPAGVFASKNAANNSSPYCKFNDQKLQTFTSCLFLAGAYCCHATVDVQYQASVCTAHSLE